MDFSLAFFKKCRTIGLFAMPSLLSNLSAKLLFTHFSFIGARADIILARALLDFTPAFVFLFLTLDFTFAIHHFLAVF
jgi:hypothetical protein